MKILKAYDLTGSFRDAAELAGCSHHTVAAHVAARDAGGRSGRAVARPQLIDAYLDKVEEWVEHLAGKIRADRAHEKLLGLGYAGSERTTRRRRPGGVVQSRAPVSRVCRSRSQGMSPPARTMSTCRVERPCRAT